MAEEQQKAKKSGPPTFILPNKQVMPLLGLGTYQIYQEQILLELLRKGVQIGIRHIDTARFYNNEIPLGSAINKVIKEGRVKRQQLFIATKTFPRKDLHPVLQLKQALRLMNLKYVDLYYMHWPVIDMDQTGKVWNHRPLEEYWKDMQQCVRKGYAKHIAVSNFNGQLLGDLLTFCKIRPVANQIQTHPYLQQQPLVDYCLKNGIAVIGHTPLVRGQDCLKENVNILKEELICDIAAKRSNTPAQIVLKFNLARGVGVIPKTRNVNRLVQNYDSWKAELTDDEMKKIRNIQKTVRDCDGRNFMKHFTPFD